MRRHARWVMIAVMTAPGVDQLGGRLEPAARAFDAVDCNRPISSVPEDPGDLSDHDDVGITLLDHLNGKFELPPLPEPCCPVDVLQDRGQFGAHPRAVVNRGQLQVG